MTRTRFAEVADRVWVGRYDWCDVNIVAIGSTAGLVVVDTHGSTAAGARVRADLDALGRVAAVVNTHWHFDHTFGNAAFADVTIHAHEQAARELEQGFDDVRAAYRADAADPHRDEVAATDLRLPDETFSSARVLDLGDRVVELVHPGRGHTAGDLVVQVPDAGVLVAGDLVEESAPPSYGEDCWPMEWPLALDLVLSMTTSASVVVPGHGAPVDRDFVEEQRHQIGTVAETIRDLAGRGVPLGLALDSADWPFPAATLRHAVSRGYQQLPRAQRRLPLV